MKTNREKYIEAFSILHASEVDVHAFSKKRRCAIKPAIAVAVCSIVCLLAVVGTGGLDNGMPDGFSIIVNAETLSQESLITLKCDNEGSGAAVSETENGEIAYSIEAPITCKGTDIERIHYYINNGAFQINHRGSKSIIVNGSRLESMNVPSIAPPKAKPGSEDEIYKEDYYSDYIVKYDNQTSDNMIVNVCGINKGLCAKDFFGVRDMEQEKRAWNKLVNSIEITCKVIYKNGDEREEKIGMQAVVVDDKERSPYVTIAYKLL